MSFDIALSGIQAINESLETTSNNIANAATYGFKSSRANFSSVYAGTQPLTPEDIADTVYWLAMLPEHVTVTSMTMMPNCQSFGPLVIKRQF